MAGEPLDVAEDAACRCRTRARRRQRGRERPRSDARTPGRSGSRRRPAAPPPQPTLMTPGDDGERRESRATDGPARASSGRSGESLPRRRSNSAKAHVAGTAVMTRTGTQHGAVPRPAERPSCMLQHPIGAGRPHRVMRDDDDGAAAPDTLPLMTRSGRRRSPRRGGHPARPAAAPAGSRTVPERWRRVAAGPWTAGARAPRPGCRGRRAASRAGAEAGPLGGPSLTRSWLASGVAEADVVGDAAGEEVRGLRHPGKLAPQPRPARPHRVRAGRRRRCAPPPRRLDEAEQQREQRALAGAARTDDREVLPRHDACARSSFSAGSSRPG